MMQRRLEILTEELSMKRFLEGLLPRVLPEEFQLGVNCFIYDHSGRSDLQKRLSSRVRAYATYPQEVLLLVVHDQDSNDCVSLKNDLVERIKNSNPDIRFSVRIACRELENWYFGDLESVERVYPKTRAGRLKSKSKFRNPDLLNGADEMKRLTDDFGKVSCAREIGLIIGLDQNSSCSFGHFLSGLQRLVS